MHALRLALGLAIAGSVLIIVGRAQPVALPDPVETREVTVLAAPDEKPALGRSVPVGLEIPAIGVRTGVVPIGLRPDRTLDVPAPHGDSPAAWYEQSPTPGEIGSSVIVGHVDSAHDGPAVFYQLRLLRPGDQIVVRRADGSQVRFAVTGVAMYPKQVFPAEVVYAPRDHPELTLITCGGRFDRERRSYVANLMVFARGVA